MTNLSLVFMQAAAPQQGSSWGFWIMIIAMIAIMYFFMIRPQNKKQKENTYEDESSEDINSFSYLNNYPEDEQQDSVANLNEELE